MNDNFVPEKFQNMDKALRIMYNSDVRVGYSLFLLKFNRVRGKRMSVNFEKTSTNEGVLKFSVSEEEVQKALKLAFNRIKKTINVPGFRKGKVNYQIFKKMFGEETLYEDAIQFLLPSAYQKALEESDLDIVTQPEFDIDSIGKDQEWVFKANVCLKPEVKLGEYKNLKVSKVDTDVKDKEIQDRLKAAQENLAELSLKDGAAEMGDTVVIDFEGFKNGEAFPGGKGENHSLELGSNSFIPGFEEQLVGVKEGDEVTVSVTFPEEYHAEDLAGQAAEFKVKVHEVKEKQVPEMDDEFAKDVDEEVSSLDELKDKYARELEEAKQRQAKEAQEEEALRKAVENAEIIDLPKAMVDDEVNRQVDHYLNEMKRQGIAPEMYYQLTGTSEADLREQFNKDADLRVKTNLLLEKIVEVEGIEASEEDIKEEIKNLADTYSMEVEQVEQVVTKDMLSKDIALKKAMNLITDTAVAE